ncbi:hypothetical protein BpHYR1_047095 [Brachionus plicatilis]|uniref:Uncharacterized protein n=1 Tax=Brachionus plicatilis TaxID=10195 RepID=A0A3M7Q9J6_BRAPC|nr:hypothetical protein BpHYR1_047095 [Brachionus plicatilis]
MPLRRTYKSLILYDFIIKLNMPPNKMYVIRVILILVQTLNALNINRLLNIFLFWVSINLKCKILFFICSLPKISNKIRFLIIVFQFYKLKTALKIIIIT